MSSSIRRAVELIERDHGGCDSNTCTIGVALRNGFDLVAIDAWIGSGAASEDFPRKLDFSIGDVTRQAQEMCNTLPHIECPHCNSVLWEPEGCGYWCDSCGKQIENN